MIITLAKNFYWVYNDVDQMVSTINQKRGGVVMARNTGDNHRHGAVNTRTQAYNPKSDTWVKRDSITGRFMDVKSGGKPFKGVTKEK